MMENEPIKKTSLYKQAYKQCDQYFDSVKIPGETWRGKVVSRDAAREAFNHKHGDSGSVGPGIFTEDDIAEFVALFREFLGIYLRYVRGPEAE